MSLLNFPMVSELSDNSNYSELAKVNSGRYEAKNHKKILWAARLKQGVLKIFTAAFSVLSRLRKASR
jgi:hypothetical protein